MNGSDAQGNAPQPPERQGARRGFSGIVLGTVLGQVVTFFALPVLSRFYSPDQFGALTFALAVASIVAPIALLGMDQALIQPRDDRDVAPLLRAGGSSLVITALLVAALIAWSPLASAFPVALVPFLVVAIPALLLLTGMLLQLTQLAVRAGRYTSIGSRNTVQSVTITASQLTLVGTVKTIGFNGLISGAVIGTAAGFVLMMRYAKPYLRRITRREITSGVRRYWRFPLVFAPMTSVTLLAQQAPALFALFWFGAANAGFVGMAERLVAVPLALIGLAASSVFTGELSHALRTDAPHKERIFLKTSGLLAIPAAGVALALLFLAEPLLPVFLGAEWVTTSGIAQSMALVAATRMITNPTRGVFRVLERARVLTIVELLRVILLVIGVMLAMTLSLNLITSLTVLFTAMAVADVVTWICGWMVVRPRR